MDGRVGIGTTAPGAMLDVAGSVRATGITVGVPGSLEPIAAMDVDVVSFGTGENARASHFMRMRDVGGASTPFIVRGDGNVGIGTADPGARLHVAGDVKFTGELLDGTVPWARLSGHPDIIAGEGLLGGGELSASRTFSLAAPTSTALGGVHLASCAYGEVLRAIDTAGKPVCEVLNSWTWRTVPRTNLLTRLDDQAFVQRPTSMTIGTDGLPVVAYHDATFADLKVAKCGNAACSAGNTITTVDNIGDVGSYTSIAIGTDGLPVISYADGTSRDLKLAHLANEFGVHNLWRRG
ncbi:MAG: hypothetical protein ACT4PT_12725 [Methanobacteriota archaeon]